MSWEDINREARLNVHAEFGRAAVYVAPGSSRRQRVTVRLHNRVARFGDNDREGYAEVVEDINRIVFLRSEVVPARGGEVTVSGSIFRVETLEPSTDGDALVITNVVRKGPSP